MAAGSLPAEPIRPGAGHESFLRHRNFRWLKVAIALSAFCALAYLFTRPAPRHTGGDVLGYTLGTVSLLLVVWLTLLGLRKRAITSGRWSLKAWTSAHVYLGLSLVVVATLHTGFQFDWNVHTLAYLLMLLVIGSGLFGIFYYGTLPRRMSDNRAETSEPGMLAEIAALDAEIRAAARPLPDAEAFVVRRALETPHFRGGLFERLARTHPHCPTRRAVEQLRGRSGSPGEATQRVLTLLLRKEAQLQQTRTHIRYRALMELWLYVHVPATFALLAALTAHVVLVFWFW